MKNHNLKSLIRTILGVFLLAVAITFSTGGVSEDQFGQKAESVNAETSQLGFALEIGAQSAPRNLTGVPASYTPIGGTERPKTKLPAVWATTTADEGDLTQVEALSLDIGGQSAPRNSNGGRGFYISIGGTEVPKTKLPKATSATIAVISKHRTSAVVAGFDIGGPQTPPRDIGRPRVATNCLTKKLES